MAVSVHDIGPISAVIYSNLSVLSSANITAKDVINATFYCVRHPDKISMMAKYLHDLKCMAPDDVRETEVELIELTIRHCTPEIINMMKFCNVDETGYMALTHITEYNGSSSGRMISAPTEDKLHLDYWRATGQQIF